MNYFHLWSLIGTFLLFQAPTGLAQSSKQDARKVIYLDIKYGLTPKPTGIKREEILQALATKIPAGYTLKLVPLPWLQRAWGADKSHAIQYKEDKRNGASLLKLKIKDGYPPIYQSSRMGNTVVTTYAKYMPTHHYNLFRLKLKTKRRQKQNWRTFETKRISFKKSIEQLPILILE